MLNLQSLSLTKLTFIKIVTKHMPKGDDEQSFKFVRILKKGNEWLKEMKTRK